MSIEKELSELLLRIGAVQFGEFTLKNGRKSPFYLDLRILVSHPAALARVGRAMIRRVDAVSYDRLAGIPYAGLPIAVAMSMISGRPLVYARKELKVYGTKQQVEGEFHVGERVLMVDDVITSGGAKLEAMAPLRDAGLVVEDVVVLVDRRSGDGAALAAAGLRLHSVLEVGTLLDHLRGAEAVDDADLRRAREFLAE
jgi:uridine monophosphate synthetase